MFLMSMTACKLLPQYSMGVTRVGSRLLEVIYLVSDMSKTR